MILNSDFLFFLKDVLSSFPYVRSKPHRSPYFDASLKKSLAEFQKYKRLSATDGSLNEETFQALGEELSSVQMNFLTTHQPQLRQLFTGRRRNGFAYRSNSILETVTLGLNIVYDEKQYTLEQAQSAAKDTVKDAQDTYGAINIEFNVSYSPGQGDSNYVNFNGVFGRIAKGAKDGKINVFLFANNKYNGKSGSLYNPKTEQVFVWEGSMAETPTAKNATKSLSSGAIAHELAHLFFQYAGLPMDENIGNNLSQDGGIIYALNQMRYNPLFIPDPELPDDFDYKKAGGNIPTIDYTPPRKSVWNPTYEQLLRLGARRVAAHFK